MDPLARVVVVDDAPFARKQLGDLLRSAGLDVVAEGEDGLAAVELFETHRPDVMTLDMVMPVMDGLSALKQIIAAHPEARVVICSSVNDEKTLIDAAAAGARDYVTKPIDPDGFISAVRKALMS